MQPQATDQIADIVVTAQKRAEDVQRVPIAITAITAGDLAAKGVASVQDLDTVVPGLNFSTSAAALLPRIRGVGSQIATGGNENSVATYIDGVYIGASSGATMQLNNISQVAVLKGPQGTLFGRNATGGVIQITTLDPKSEFGGQASVTYGNLDTIGANLYLTSGIGENVSADFAGYYNNQGKGFGKNVFTGNDVHKQRDIALRSKLKIEVGDSTVIRLSGDYSKVLGPFGGRLPIDVQGNTPPGLSKFDLNHNVDVRQSVEQWGGGITIDHDFSFAKLTSITAYRRAKSDSFGDVDATPMPFFIGDIVMNERQFTQEFDLTSTATGSLKWTLGAFYYHSTAHEVDTLQIGPDQTLHNTHQVANSYAAFGQVQYEIAPSTNLTAGLRFTRDEKDFRGIERDYDFTGTAIFAPGEARGQLRDDRLTWRLAIDHNLTATTLIYASYSRGYKSAGFNLGHGAPPANSFKPESLDAYEAGLKTDLFNRTVRLNIASFYYDYKNIQVNVFTQDPEPQIASGGPATVYGLDADLLIRPTSRLSLTAGLLLDHTRFNNFPDAPISSLSPFGPFPVVSTIGSATGNRLPQAPSWTLNAGFDYTIPVGASALKLDGNFYHNDGFYGEADNRLRQKAYNLLNGSATLMFGSSKRFQLTLWGKNLTNTAYATNIASFPTTDFEVIANGRSYGATLGAKF